ncbi:unnamed protein product [Pleuronectes platessa]|uniref:Uncharacterized protein n=1 Tax=Pleuronectes platessa TaxID=8262 RepID=A0A9N7V0K0_PLEPL|nr:unnamed protein product [Pleuronectes platessa]
MSEHRGLDLQSGPRPSNADTQKYVWAVSVSADGDGRQPQLLGFTLISSQTVLIVLHLHSEVTGGQLNFITATAATARPAEPLNNTSVTTWQALGSMLTASGGSEDRQQQQSVLV